MKGLERFKPKPLLLTLSPLILNLPRLKYLINILSQFTPRLLLFCINSPLHKLYEIVIFVICNFFSYLPYGNEHVEECLVFS